MTGYISLTWLLGQQVHGAEIVDIGNITDIANIADIANTVKETETDQETWSKI